MPGLDDDLAALVRTIVRHDAPSMRITARYPNYSVDVAMEVYRNSYRGNLHDALAGAYPVIEQLVGKDFFRRLAREFIGQHPSISGNLHDYGAGMANFIAAFESVQKLVYLPDVAALEWACHRAYFEEDVAEFDIATLANVPPEHYADLILHLNPACRLLRSRYPIAAIWHAHQPGAPVDFRIDLEAGPCNALVSRKEGVVQVNALSDAEAAWLQGIWSGMPLGAATVAVLQQYSGFDLQSALLKLLQRGALSSE
jgi:hypothetical protein